MKPKYSVLVIDDQENWRDLLCEILQEQFDVKRAYSYDTALNAIQEQSPPFHVVVTDLRLVDEKSGNEDGLKLAEYLNHRGDETKVIIITGYATIDSAKRAFSRLAAFDYLEKRPSEGQGLNIEELRETVYQAAQQAESRRISGFRDLNQNILVLEPDPVWRNRLKESLGDNGYHVYAAETDEDLLESILDTAGNYALILINESLSSEKLLDSLHRSQDDARIVILTRKDIDHILGVMQDYPVITAFNLHNDKFDAHAFREFIHRVLSEVATKYVTTQIQFEDQLLQDLQQSPYGCELEVGKTYSVSLSIQETAVRNATPIYLEPLEEKRGRIRLHLFVHAPQMRLNPGAEGYWNIPMTMERPPRFQFWITPQNEGENEITIEIDQNRRWLGRIKLHILSTKEQSLL